MTTSRQEFLEIVEKEQGANLSNRISVYAEYLLEYLDRCAIFAAKTSYSPSVIRGDLGSCVKAAVAEMLHEFEKLPAYESMAGLRLFSAHREKWEPSDATETKEFIVNGILWASLFVTGNRGKELAARVFRDNKDLLDSCKLD